LKPLHHLLLCTLLTEIVKERPLLVITMFILKNRGRLLAAEADSIPEIVIFGITGAHEMRNDINARKEMVWKLQPGR